MKSVAVLDQGFVQYVEHMGTDRSIAEAAWVSMDSCKGRTEDEVKRVIRYLVKHDHWTPLAQASVKLHFRMPIFVARQLMRSNIGIAYNEISRRYVDTDIEYHMPSEWRSRPDKSIKQGSGEALPEADQDLVDQAYMKLLEEAHKFYALAKRYNVAPEQARLGMLLSGYTEVIASMSVAAAARVYKLRVEQHAQKEIQLYAQAIGAVIEPLFPITWEALTSKIIQEQKD